MTGDDAGLSKSRRVRVVGECRRAVTGVDNYLRNDEGTRFGGLEPPREPVPSSVLAEMSDGGAFSAVGTGGRAVRLLSLLSGIEIVDGIQNVGDSEWLVLRHLVMSKALVTDTILTNLDVFLFPENERLQDPAVKRYRPERREHSKHRPGQLRFRRPRPGAMKPADRRSPGRSLTRVKIFRRAGILSFGLSFRVDIARVLDLVGRTAAEELPVDKNGQSAKENDRE